MPDILRAQHDAGRAITTYILETCGRGGVAKADAAKFAHTLRDFVWMYQNHAAREDTILFPAWKKMLGNEYQDASREFDRLTHQHWGRAGFEDAAGQLTQIETDFGMENLGQFTATIPEGARATAAKPQSGS
jgi:hemerythrin-like domain-containing protein